MVGGDDSGRDTQDGERRGPGISDDELLRFLRLPAQGFSYREGRTLRKSM